MSSAAPVHFVDAEWHSPSRCGIEHMTLADREWTDDRAAVTCRSCVESLEKTPPVWHEPHALLCDKDGDEEDGCRQIVGHEGPCVRANGEVILRRRAPEPDHAPGCGLDRDRRGLCAPMAASGHAEPPEAIDWHTLNVGANVPRPEFQTTPNHIQSIIDKVTAQKPKPMFLTTGRWKSAAEREAVRMGMLAKTPGPPFTDPVATRALDVVRRANESLDELRRYIQDGGDPSAVLAMASDMIKSGDVTAEQVRPLLDTPVADMIRVGDYTFGGVIATPSETCLLPDLNGLPCVLARGHGPMHDGRPVVAAAPATNPFPLGEHERKMAACLRECVNTLAGRIEDAIRLHAEGEPLNAAKAVARTMDELESLRDMVTVPFGAERDEPEFVQDSWRVPYAPDVPFPFRHYPHGPLDFPQEAVATGRQRIGWTPPATAPEPDTFFGQPRKSDGVKWWSEKPVNIEQALIAANAELKRLGETVHGLLPHSNSFTLCGAEATADAWVTRDSANVTCDKCKRPPSNGGLVSGLAMWNPDWSGPMETK